MSQAVATATEPQGQTSGHATIEVLPRADDVLLFRTIFGLPLLQRVQLVKRGVPAKWFVKVSGRMAMPKDKLYKTIGVAKATITRKSRGNEKLDLNESERAMAMMVLLGQVEAIVAESGTVPDFDSATWTAKWLDSSQPALGGRRPGDLMDTADGRTLVSDLLARMQSGAYA
jgi:putative toxin-antitoxin system antitoxin component (TIGR02293 family)